MLTPLQFYIALMAKAKEMCGDGLDFHWITEPDVELAKEYAMYQSGKTLEEIVNHLWDEAYPQ